MATKPLVKIEQVNAAIRVVRGQRVMLDSDLATLYGVTTAALIQAVQRNRLRFPSDFMFQLNRQEWENLKSQIVISSSGHGGRRRSTPQAFTEQGVAMLSSVLRSKRAVLVNVEIMRAFVRLRGMLAAHAELAERLDALEVRYDEQFRDVFEAIRVLMAPPEVPELPKRRIGYPTGVGEGEHRVEEEASLWNEGGPLVAVEPTPRGRSAVA